MGQTSKNLFLLSSFILFAGCAPQDLSNIIDPLNPPITPECESDTDCAMGEICDEAGECVVATTCTTDTECGMNEICSAENLCVPEPDEGACVDNSDCAAGEFCSSSDVCIPEDTCLSRADCDEGLLCNTDGECVPDHTCGGQDVDVEITRPRALILLDRSVSMKGGNFSDASKWEAALGALTLMVGDPLHADRIDWGLSFFPEAKPEAKRTSSNKCTIQSSVYPLATESDHIVGDLCGADLIDSAFTVPVTGQLCDAADENSFFFPGWPNRVTNINVAVKTARNEPAFANAMNELEGVNNVILITDGNQENCGSYAGTPQEEITALYAQGVRTYVLAVGTGGTDGKLQEMAVAGAGGDESASFYRAVDEAQLENALSEIAGGLTSCVISLEEEPANENNITVRFNGEEELIYQGADGWYYRLDDGHPVIELLGNACERWTSGDLDGDGQVDDSLNLDIAYSCSGPSGS